MINPQPRAKTLGEVGMARESASAAVWRKVQLRGAAAAPTGYFPAARLMTTQVLAWIVNYLKHRFVPRAAFASYGAGADQGVYPLEAEPGEVRVALAGDWASGTAEAALVAQRITEAAPAITVHLGDVYFDGDPDEVRENFLGEAVPGSRFIPVQWPKGTRRSFALNGNHEMYAGGRGYFGLMLQWLGQRASYFALEGEHWRIIALDTGYRSVGLPVVEKLFQPDCALNAEQIAWLGQQFGPASGRAAKATIVLSHHQPLSRYQRAYPRQAEQIAGVINGPVLWFWGHEHWLTVYEPASLPGGVTAHGRCIGHGGMPCELPDAAPHPQYAVRFHDDRAYATVDGRVLGFNGHVLLRFDGAALAVDYVDLSGATVFSEHWHAGTGGAMARIAGS